MKKFLSVILLLFSFAYAEKASLEEVSEAMDNPLSYIWLLFMQNNYTMKELDSGEKINTNTFMFQPVMSFNITGNWNFILRPSLNWITSDDGHTRFGDSQVIGLVGNTLKLGGDKKLTLGIGGAYSAPTGTRYGIDTIDQTGVGFSGLTVFNTTRFTAGGLLQYFKGVNPKDGVDTVSIGTLRYFIGYKFSPSWQIGTAPVISYNPDASSGNKLTLPIGLSITYTGFIAGVLPARIQLGIESDVVRPDSIKSSNRIVVMFVPVVPKYFGLWK